MSHTNFDFWLIFSCFFDVFVSMWSLSSKCTSIHLSTPILFFFIYKNLKKLGRRRCVDLCEKRYEHIHAEKIGFLLKFLHLRGNLLKNSMFMSVKIHYYDLRNINDHIYDQNNHLSLQKISFQILISCTSKILRTPK